MAVLTTDFKKPYRFSSITIRYADGSCDTVALSKKDVVGFGMDDGEDDVIAIEVPEIITPRRK